MLLAEQPLYDYIYEEPIQRPQKTKKRKSKVKRIKKIKRAKYISFLLLGFIIGIAILIQYANINIINKEINSLERELQRLHMLNDSAEGELLASADLKKIEKIAREELGMIDPAPEQMTIIEIQNSQDIKMASANIDNDSSSKLSEYVSKVLDFID
ncbi:MAG TPA: hypothetical protein GXZ78_07475 [Eubacteriaceae bacterium]|nr:hypothetical protein [Eubacteriaceae bacterium]